MPPSSPPTPLERLLCWLLPALIVLVHALFPLMGGRDYAAATVAIAKYWAREQWDLIFHGSLPEFSWFDLNYLMLVGLPIGALVLVPALLVQRACWGRWWRPAALWFWTALYGFLPAASAVLPVVEALIKPSNEFADWRHLSLLYFSEITVGLAITVLGFRAWRWRRREDRAALAADTAADPTSPD